MANDKKKGCNSGCLKIAAIGFVIFMIIGFIGNLISNNEWKKNRPEVLASVERAVEAGDYESAFSLAEPHKSRDDAKLNTLLSKAENLKREAEERAKQARIVALVAKIKDSTGEDRASLLQDLVSLDSRTEEFPDEIAAIRERAKKLKQEADDFIANGTGKKVPFAKWDIYGSPETLEGTNNKYWIAYLPEIDVSFVSEKTTDKVIFVGRGKKAAPDYLANKDADRKKRLEGGFSAWDGSHCGLTKVIKESMNDPKSYEHVDTKYWDMGDHLVVTTTFRGKNAFGGVIKNWVKAKRDLDGNVLKVIEQGP
jgi:hypothetical protein